MNVNYLEGMRCPECGSYEPFIIEASVLVKAWDDGTEDSYFGDTEWGDASYCKCDECGHEGIAADFQMRTAMVPDDVGNGLHEEYEELDDE
jgi:hypothetical protein